MSSSKAVRCGSSSESQWARVTLPGLFQSGLNGRKSSGICFRACGWVPSAKSVPKTGLHAGPGFTRPCTGKPPDVSPSRPLEGNRDLRAPVSNADNYRRHNAPVNGSRRSVRSSGRSRSEMPGENRRTFLKRMGQAGLAAAVAQMLAGRQSSGAPDPASTLPILETQAGHRAHRCVAQVACRAHSSPRGGRPAEASMLSCSAK